MFVTICVPDDLEVTSPFNSPIGNKVNVYEQSCFLLLSDMHWHYENQSSLCASDLGAG
jgi:hypothetical protein